MNKTVKIPKSHIMPPIDYSELLRDKGYGDLELLFTYLDTIRFVDGKIVAFDAASNVREYQPFDVIFPQEGKPFAVSVYTTDGKLIALSGVLFSDGVPDRWEKAAPIGSDKAKLIESEEALSVHIPSGFIAYGSLQVYCDYRAEQSETPFPLEYAVKDVDNTAATEGDLALFSTGLGEGNYDSYIGYCGGKITALISDFQLIRPPKLPSGYVEAKTVYNTTAKVSDQLKQTTSMTSVIESAVSDSERAQALIKRAVAYHSMGDTERALEDYMRAVEYKDALITSGNGVKLLNAYENGAQLARDLGRFSDAVALYKQELYARLPSPVPFSGLISIFLEQKMADKALEVANQMVNHRPYDANSFLMRAETYLSLLDYERAARDYRTLCDGFKLKEYVYDLVSCLIELGNYEQAEKDLNASFSHTVMNEQYYYYMGQIRYRTGDIEKAHKYLISAHIHNPSFIPTLHMLLEIEELFGDYKHVISLSSKYIERRADNEYGYYSRAIAYSEEKMYSHAIAQTEFLIKHYPAAVCDQALVILCATAEDFARAERALKRLKRGSESYKICFLYLSLIKKRLKPTKTPTIFIKNALESDVQLLLSSCLIRYGMKDIAKDILLRIRAFATESDVAARADLRLLRINPTDEAIDEYCKTYISENTSAELKQKIKERCIEAAKP